MRNTNKKGFTIVELVVVVAVIAILAAVLIPTFSGIIAKANRSADQSAIATMNKYLAMEEADGKNANLPEALADLMAHDVDAKDYKALAKGMNIVWAKSLNRVLYINSETKKVEYPEQYVNEQYNVGCGWYALYGEIAEDDSWVENASAGAVSVSSGAELVSLMNAYTDGTNDNHDAAKAITKITLTEDIDLMGAEASFGQITNDFEISGPADGVAIYGLRSGANAWALNNKQFGYGFIGMVGEQNADTNYTVTIKNITFDGAVVDSSHEDDAGHAGVVVGKVCVGAYIKAADAAVAGGDILVLENVTVQNCYVNSEKKAGALVGYVQGDAKAGVSIDDAVVKLYGKITVKNNVITAAREAAAAIAYVQGSLVVDSGATIDVSGNSVSKSNSDFVLKYTYGADGSVKEGSKARLGFTDNAYWHGETSATSSKAKDFN